MRYFFPLMIIACSGGEIKTSEPSSSPTSDPSSEPSTEPSEDDYTQAGPYTVQSSSATFMGTNCATGMAYQVYTPAGVSNPTVLVLGHGFLRGGSLSGTHTMYDWGAHYASWGIEVLVPTLCHYSPLAVDHEMNGQNMVELAQHHGASSVIYGGQSAGGLAAIIAASQDSSTLGVVGLDATDTEGVPGVDDFIGQNYAGSVQQPAYALVAEPSTCNSNNNGITLFEMMGEAQVLRVSDSDHCDYESPTDWGCTSFCLNQSSTFSDEEIFSVVAHLSTAAILALTGDSTAQDAWLDSNMGDWISSGQVIRLR